MVRIERKQAENPRSVRRTPCTSLLPHDFNLGARLSHPGACPDTLVEPGGDSNALTSKRHYSHELGSRQSGSKSRTFPLRAGLTLKNGAGGSPPRPTFPSSSLFPPLSLALAFPAIQAHMLVLQLLPLYHGEYRRYCRYTGRSRC
jgi:hypothetical protein